MYRVKVEALEHQGPGSQNSQKNDTKEELSVLFLAAWGTVIQVAKVLSH